MRICHVASHEGVYRGGAVQLCRMAIAQKAAGHEVCVIAYERRRRDPKKKDRDRETWKALAGAGVHLEFMDYFRFSEKFRMRRMFARRGIEVVHAHRDEALVVAAQSLIGLTRPVLIAQRGTTSPPPVTIARLFRSPKVRAIVAVAEAVKKALIEETGVPGEKVRVVYGSVNPGQFAPRPKDAALLGELGIPAGAPVIGSLSAYRKAKGLEKLIKSLKPVLESRPEAHAVFIGNFVGRKLAPKAAKWDLPSRFHFLDHQFDMPRWLSIMDLTVVAAMGREGLSGVLRESLSMEIPVISTDCSGNPEIVRDKRTGLLVPAGNRDAMTEALNWALDHPDEMRRMAVEGRKWVAENCAPEVQIRGLLETYQEALRPAGTQASH